MFLIFILIIITPIICAPITNEQGMNYLMNFGYTNNQSINTMNDKEIKESIEKFQQFVNISVTGVLDEQTKKIMEKPRCRMQDTLIFEYIGKWNDSPLTYQFANFPDKYINESATKRVIKNAMRLWLIKIDLIVKEEHDPENDPHLIIAFINDTIVNNMQGVVGYAEAPPSGNIVLLYENIFENEVNLYHVAAHEIGHALGLNHLNDPTSIMYPMYDYYDYDEIKLNALEIQYIQLLYGKKYNPCQNGSIDAAVSINNSIYILRDFEIWRYSDGKLHPEYPKVLSEQFPGLRSRVNASFYYNNVVYFIEGKKVFKFNGTYTQYFDTLELDFQAAVTIDDRLYTFKGSQYWRYNINNDGMRMVKEQFPRKISRLWTGVPSDIDAVLYYNGDAYFFKGTNYYKFDIHAAYYNKTEKKHIANWVGCGK